MVEDSRRLQIVRCVAILVLALCLAPCATDAQQATRVFRLGLLSAGSPSLGAAEAFRQELRALGYVEGQQIALCGQC